MSSETSSDVSDTVPFLEKAIDETGSPWRKKSTSLTVSRTTAYALAFGFILSLLVNVVFVLSWFAGWKNTPLDEPVTHFGQYKQCISLSLSHC